MRTLFLAAFAVACADPGSSPADAVEVDGAARESCAVTVPGDFATVQDAVDAAADGDTVCVGAGTFPGTVSVVGRDVRIAGKGRARTVLDGGGLGTTVAVDGGSAVELAGLTVTGGAGGDGGGISIVSSTALLENLTVSDNTATSRGGGVFVLSSTVDADDVRVVRNTSALTGGGLSVGAATFTGADLYVARNVSLDYGGGGMASGAATTTITNSTFVANVSRGAFGGGGGLELDNAGAVLENVVVAGNRSEAPGAGVKLAGYNHTDVLTNVALVGNEAPDAGGLHVSGTGVTARIVNAAIAYNADTGVLVDAGNALDIAYSAFFDNDGHDVNGAPWPVGTDGNVTADPMFVSMAGAPQRWDLHLQPGSALVDAGDPALLDPDGTRSDIGAYGGPGSP